MSCMYTECENVVLPHPVLASLIKLPQCLQELEEQLAHEWKLKNAHDTRELAKTAQVVARSHAVRLIQRRWRFLRAQPRVIVKPPSTKKGKKGSKKGVKSGKAGAKKAIKGKEAKEGGKKAGGKAKKAEGGAKKAAGAKKKAAGGGKKAGGSKKAATAKKSTKK